MKKMMKILLIALLLPAYILIQAQTAGEIISKHVLALGGKDILDKINTMSVESSTQVMGQ